MPSDRLRIDAAHWPRRLNVLAERHDVPGAVLGVLRATTIVYHLRKGVRFSNNDPLTPRDVAWSINHDFGPGAVISAAYAVDGAGLAQAIFHGESGPVPILVTTAELAQSAYPHEFTFPLRYWAGRGRTDLTAQSVQHTLRQIGLTVAIRRPYEVDRRISEVSSVMSSQQCPSILCRLTMTDGAAAESIEA
jgi:hypothetical protein